MDYETKYKLAKGALMALCVVAYFISYNGACGVQEKIEMRREALSKADDEYLNLKSTLRYIGNNSSRQREIDSLKSKMASLKQEYDLYSGYNDPVINRLENSRMSWMWILVFSVMGLGALCKPVRWLMYAVLAGAGINMLRNNN